MSDFGLIINGEKVVATEIFGVVNPAKEEIVGQFVTAARATN